MKGSLSALQATLWGERRKKKEYLRTRLRKINRPIYNGGNWSNDSEEMP